MKRSALIFSLVAATLGGLAPAARAEPVPGVFFTQTVRSGATIADKDANARALERGENFSVAGQILNSPTGSALALILSNGDALFLPNGGRLTLEEFTQEPVFDTGRDRAYEPTRSNLRLNFALGTLVLTERKPVATSTLTLTTPLAQLRCQSQSLVVRVDGDSVTITLLDGTVEVTVPETGFHDTIQAGQTATLTRKSQHDAYPMKIAPNGADDIDRFTAWAETARSTEKRVVFFGPNYKQLLARLRVPQEFTTQMSADEPRYW